MHYDIHPVEMAASIRVNELRSRADHRHLVRQVTRQRRQALAKRVIAVLHKGLDSIESILDESEPAPSAQAIR